MSVFLCRPLRRAARRSFSTTLLATMIGLAGAAEPAHSTSTTQTLGHLIAAATAYHPTQLASEAARSAAEAEVRSAGRWDNPELELSVGRTSPRTAGLDRDQPYGGSLRQRLVWLGTRQARSDAAQAHAGAVQAGGQLAQLQLAAEVRRAAIAYTQARQAATQAAAEAAIAHELGAVTELRFAAGDSDRATVAQARLEALTAKVQHEARQREVETALSALRSWCGPDLPDRLEVSDALTVAAPMGEQAAQHPQLTALTRTVAAAESTLAAERSARIPDLTVGVFADREAEKDTYGVTLGIDLPLWDRNEAGIAAAYAQRAQAQAEARSAELRLRRDLATALGTIQTAQGEAQILNDQAVPVAEEVLSLRLRGYKTGESSMAEVLEARRTLNAVRTALSEARARAAYGTVELSLALGDPTVGLGALPTR
jgi:cobalt-zinc-cadmium efflux system outer membrane protein